LTDFQTVELREGGGGRLGHGVEVAARLREVGARGMSNQHLPSFGDRASAKKSMSSN